MVFLEFTDYGRKVTPTGRNILLYHRKKEFVRLESDTVKLRKSGNLMV